MSWSKIQDATGCSRSTILKISKRAAARISAKLVEKAEEGDLAAIREIADRLDGKSVQMLDRRDVSINELTDAELLAIAAGALPEHKDDNTKLLLLPPAPKSKP